MKSQQIRQKFLDFFKVKGHSVVSSAPIVIKNDPTLMFTNAGMNQFKDLFLGISEVKDARVVNSQKCLRVSGKHNDLEEVGHDTYHHTMFEMLGNWSFGDYFKKEAIDWAWELLTDVYGIDKDRLYVTVFEGAKEDQLDKDQEAYDCWKAHVSEDRILNGNKKDNFWEMGDVGPCGPCSEIHIDLRPDEDRAKVDARTLVNYDHPQVVEVWNLVFMQYNRKSNGSLENLPNTHVDTGMGFERLAMALQGKQSNYDTDVFTPLIDKVCSITGFKYGKDEKVDIALRVVSDHVRAIAFAVADGQLPSNNGAGYVIRRILRRAVRYGFTFLNQIALIRKLFVNKFCLNFELLGLTNSHRIIIWSNALQLLKDKYIFGYGASSFSTIYSDRMCNEFRECLRYTTHAHNILIELAINYGLIVSILLAIFVTTVLYKSFKKIYLKGNIHRIKDNFDKAWWASIFAITLSHLYDIQYYDLRISISSWILLSGLSSIIKE